MRHAPLEPLALDQEPDEFAVELDNRPATSDDDDHRIHLAGHSSQVHHHAPQEMSRTLVPCLNMCVTGGSGSQSSGQQTTNATTWPLKPYAASNVPDVLSDPIYSSGSLSPTSEEKLSSYSSSADLSDIDRSTYVDMCSVSRVKKDKLKRKHRSRSRPLAETSSSSSVAHQQGDLSNVGGMSTDYDAQLYCPSWSQGTKPLRLLRQSQSLYDSESEAGDEEESTSEQMRQRQSTLRHRAPQRINRDRGVAAENLCARLVDCRSIEESVRFVEKYRPVIDNLTRIVTQEAPAFRNYDFGQLQIDISAKESFNPNFWLDRSPIRTTADGNCQYHAISLSLTGNEEYMPNVRLAAAVAVIDNRDWFAQTLTLVDRGSVHCLVKTIARSYSWGDEMTLVAVSIAIKKRIYLYTCNFGKKDFETVKSLSLDELQEAFREKRYRGGTGIHAYAEPLEPVPDDDYIMILLKMEHFIAILPHNQHPIPFKPYNPIVPTFT